MEQLTLGPTPREEECAQVGTDEYPVRVRREGKAYIGQLIRMFANPPEGRSVPSHVLPTRFRELLRSRRELRSSRQDGSGVRAPRRGQSALGVG
jgi:hypothetical protein